MTAGVDTCAQVDGDHGPSAGAAAQGTARGGSERGCQGSNPRRERAAPARPLAPLSSLAGPACAGLGVGPHCQQSSHGGQFLSTSPRGLRIPHRRCQGALTGSLAPKAGGGRLWRGRTLPGMGRPGGGKDEWAASPKRSRTAMRMYARSAWTSIRNPATPRTLGRAYPGAARRQVAAGDPCLPGCRSPAQARTGLHSQSCVARRQSCGDRHWS